MGVLEDFAYWVVYTVLGIKSGDAIGEALSFFIYDTIKVFILLAVMIFLVAIARTYISSAKVRKMLGGKKEGLGNVLAALLGVPTPFCSCSAVPLFIGFMEAGVPLGVTFSFLVSCPMVNEVAVALLLGLVGWEITVLYILTGLIVAIVTGIAIGRMNLESEIEDIIRKKRSKEMKEKKWRWNERMKFAKNEMAYLVWKVAPYIVLGIGFGAFIHGFVPVGFLANVAGANNPLAVPIVVIVGIPLYSNAAGTIPIIEALMEKGMAVGTALAFMMSITALSLPEMIILRRVMKPKLLAIFAIILAISFMFVGFLFNAII